MPILSFDASVNIFFVQSVFSCIFVANSLGDYVLDNAQEIYFTEQCTGLCVSLSVPEFGPCGSLVNLTSTLRNMTTLSIRFDALDQMLKLHDRSGYYMLVLYSERAIIQWMVIFHKLETLGYWENRRGHHEAYRLWYGLSHEEQHQRNVDRPKTETWFLAVLSIPHWSVVPIVPEVPPLRLDVSKELNSINMKMITMSYYRMNNLNGIFT
ncbi:hypothetical protein P879_08783 [Paragonimus westermani]|uniref:Uncharacterized protein n=1 Tax=Paragonimus westermani TaxID=34504 RepID=A0A8T0DDF4_9TREM|nr:hypothetical protein P879_08783 [Paragonimus westermani]